MKAAAAIPRFEPTPPNPANYPRNHEPGALKAGDSVWYRDQRYWVERAPFTWEESCMVRITDQRFLPGGNLPEERISFCVHADHLSLAPTTKNRYGRQPTKKAIDRREQMRKEGTRDNGDPVAVALRGCTTLDDVYRETAALLRVPESELRAKYAHLNNGQQRMNCGNRLRGAFKSGKITLN